MQVAKKKLPKAAVHQKDLREIQSPLSGAELKNIQCGSTMLDFGSMFVKSSMRQTLWVRNDNASTIQVRF